MTSTLIYVMCMVVLLVCFSVFHLCAWYLQRPEEGVESPRTRLTDACELSCMYWKLNLGHLEVRQVLLTAESSIQPWGK